MRQLAYILVLLQVGLTGLAALGESVVMHNLIYLLVPVLRAALLLIVVTRLHRRWAAITLIALEGSGVVGFWVSAGAGVLPWVTYPVNPVGLLTDLALPGVVLYLAVRQLAGARGAA